MKVRYTYRIRPGAQALSVLMSHWNSAKYVWNACVERHKKHQPWLTCKDLTHMRATLTNTEGEHWLRESSAVVQQQAIRDFRQAKSKSRNFKSAKTSLPSMNYVQNAFSLKDDPATGKPVLVLAGGARIPVAWSRELPSTPSSARVYRDSLGHWYASFVVEIDKPEPLPETGKSIGIDWGVSRVATTTDPAYDLPHAEHGQKAASDLARLQRQMSRRQPKPGQSSSRGYKEAKLQVAKLHKKIARRRQYDSRMWARKIVLEHDVIAIEDFRPRFLSQTRMARKAADAAITAAKNTLVEYGLRAGREVVMVKPAYTTMTCSKCHARAKQRLPLSMRTFVCQSCGYVADRDENAARNVLATAGFNRAGVEAVRQETGTPRGALSCTLSQESPTLVKGRNQQQIKAWVAAYYKAYGCWPAQLETRVALRCSIDRAVIAIKEAKNDLANGAEQRFAKALAIYAGFSSLGDAFTHIDTLTEKPVSRQRKNDLRALVTILTGTAPSYSLTSEELRDIIHANTKPTPITNTEEE